MSSATAWTQSENLVPYVENKNSLQIPICKFDILEKMVYDSIEEDVCMFNIHLQKEMLYVTLVKA